jgi:hypothetical protein
MCPCRTPVARARSIWHSMKHTLERQIDDLYRLPLEEFTKARNTLAKSFSGSEKTQISSLVKPSLPMWVINQVFWQDAPTYTALTDAAEKLRAAHRSVLSGRKADTRAPDELHRTTVEKAFAKATGLAETRGVPLTDSVRETIRRTLAALPGEESPGRLTRAPEPAGFSLLSGVTVRTERPESKSPESESPKSESPKSKSPAVRAQESQIRRIELEAKKRAERERKEAAARKDREERKAREKREQEIRKAEEALRDAERRLAELKR